MYVKDHVARKNALKLSYKFPPRLKRVATLRSAISDIAFYRITSVITRDRRMLRASWPSFKRLSVCLSHSWSVSKRCKL